jgi:hypothetical protein
MGAVNHPLTIPEGFNNWPRLDQIGYYLDQGLIIHSCHGPKEKCQSPGKKPRWDIPQRLAASKLEVLAHFKRHPKDNVGMVPTGGNIQLDIDAHDRTAKEPLAAYQALYPKLFEGPYVLCDRGLHVPFFATEIPQGQKKIVVENYLPGLNLEIHVGIGAPANVILPPSVHASGHVYAWARPGGFFAAGFVPFAGGYTFNMKLQQGPNLPEVGRTLLRAICARSMSKLCAIISASTVRR